MGTKTIINLTTPLTVNKEKTNKIDEISDKDKCENEARADRWAVRLDKVEQENRQLKEELDIYKIAQKGHDKIIMDYPFLKQKLEKIKEQAQTYGFHDSKGNRLSITDEILDDGFEWKEGTRKLNKLLDSQEKE